MCGIAGILSFDPEVTVDADRLRRMRDVLTHRGPDGSGLFVDGPIGLAHRRLAIVDVAGGQQPMTNEDGTIQIVFNGEIYNHMELRPQLEAGGHRYRSRCDTETIIHAFEDSGEKAAEQLHGMFAFAIWDGTARTLTLGRDRLGIKPLYYSVGATELLFASEIKALLEVMSHRPSLDHRQLPAYLTNGYVNGEHTMFRGIKRLLPGHTLTWSCQHGVRTRRYWHLPAPASAPPRPFATEAAELREALFDAVRRHLMSDVPLGVFLSGGIDSSALASIATRLTKQPVQTFAVGFADRDANELAYARQVADAIGSHHREVTVAPGEFFEALPHLIWHEDEPIAFPSSVPLNFVSRLASQHVKVVLTGEGADELFLGYNRYRVTHWNERLGRAYWAVTPPRMRPAVRRLVGHLPGRVSRVLDRTFLGCAPGLRDIYFENFAVMSEARQRQLLSHPDLLNYDVHAHALEEFNGERGDLLDRMGRYDLQTYLHELLMKQDQMSMAASIESRVPFLDDQIVERVTALPSAMKLRGWQTKALLRAAVADLIPRAILTRRKMGFPVPIGRWLSGAFQPLLHEFVLSPRAEQRGMFDPDALRDLVQEHTSGAAQHGHRLWLLINLEIWQRIFIDREAPESVMEAAQDRAAA